MRRRTQFVAALIALGAAGAVATTVWQRAGDDVIPWVDRAVSPANLSRPTPRYVPAIPAGARPCEAPHVEIRTVGRQGLNSAAIVFSVEVRNTGRRTCAIEGRPSVTVPRRTATQISVGATQSMLGPPGFPARGARFGLRPGRTAFASVFNYHGCAGAPPRRRRSQTRLRFSYGANSVSVPVVSCEPAGAALSIAPFAPGESPPEPKPLRWPLQAELELPSAAVRGRVLEYRVKLTNISERPFRFPFCPTYEVVVGRSDPIGVLNCRPMGTLEPGEAATFAMRMKLSRHFRPSRRTIVWILADETLEDGVVARGKLEIERE